MYVDFSDDQIELMCKNRCNPNNYILISDTKNNLVLKHKRGFRRTIKKGDKKVTPEQVREVVKITLDELTQRKLIKDDYSVMLPVVESKLTSFFNNKGDGNGISYALKSLSDDLYIDVIFLQYRDCKTLEWIAEYMDVDVSTIKRNKKRLVIKIYELLEEIK